MEISFRKLSKDDREAYRNIRLECLKRFPERFGSSFEEESGIEELSFERYISQENENHFMLGAFKGEKLIGICGFRREMRGKTKHRGEIVQMYVDPDFSGKGIGHGLLKNTIEMAFENRAVSQIILSVVLENAEANKLYERIGFREYGRLENYFIQGEKAWAQRFMFLERKAFSRD